MLHHPAVHADEDGSDVAANLRSFQDYHMSQGWPDIAYHLAIGRTGGHFILRDAGIAGDTFTNYDPQGWFLILVDGNFDQQDPPPAQLEGVALAIAWAARHFDVGIDTLSAHRDHASTTCPGDSLYGLLRGGSLQTRAAELLGMGIPLLEPTCGNEAAAVVASIGAGGA